MKTPAPTPLSLSETRRLRDAGLVPRDTTAIVRDPEQPGLECWLANGGTVLIGEDGVILGTDYLIAGERCIRCDIKGAKRVRTGHCLSCAGKLTKGGKRLPERTRRWL